MITINEKTAKVLVDTICTITLVRTGVADSWSGDNNIRMVDGGAVKCFGETDTKIVVREYTAMTLSNCAG